MVNNSFPYINWDNELDIQLPSFPTSFISIFKEFISLKFLTMGYNGSFINELNIFIPSILEF